ncbi:electron transfer flavoprotein subunit alpha/FixB family protein [Ammoniphilus sp. YIM 78166]|uniref:electron transfer flavoprotein subunit alpha/FixB family protein n=1 Tax=Ammoniphilus sp. YIM 78166 TaxID=1644106 RepID=UPI00106FE62D|nr:electron transfer flavoprotein subunit alpha/FixB family protein [Ammoniphilus sp. YIM 78166]
MKRNILVFAEMKSSQLRNVSLEAVAAAKQVSGGGKVVAAIIGKGSSQHAEILAKYGADQIYVIENDKLTEYHPDLYLEAYTQLIREIDPDVVILGHTGNGRDIAPRVAAKLDYGLVSDCIKVTLDDENQMVLTRPVYSGKMFEEVKFTDQKAFVTIRPNNIAPVLQAGLGEIIPYTIQQEVPLRSVIKEIVRKASGAVDLSEAKVIVAGGRGVKGEEGFKLLQEFAKVLNGAVGASRGACDAEYCDYSLQIGQTGKVVTPELYIACGISGAIQHVAGMSNSKVIVAINKDPEAPIFDIADYGIVGDLFEIVPLLTEEFSKVLMSSAK